MHITDLVKRADDLLEMGSAVMATAYSTGGQYNVNYVNAATLAGFRAAVLSFIERVYGRDHSHFAQFSSRTKNSSRSDAEDGIAILQAIRTEIAGGWLQTIKGMVTAEVFADFIEMAEHLLDSGYKDPAAVMAGSVLEEHLRQLCGKNGVDVTKERDGKMISKKADRLNSDLSKAGAYSKLDQKLITAWMDLRNNAAHGKYHAYNADQVKQMIAGILEFMARVAP